MGIGERLKSIRKGKYTQAELAEILGVHETTIRRWESGRDDGPKEKMLSKIAAALNTTVAYLSGETDNPEHSVPAAEPKKLEEHPQIKTEDKGVLVYEANGQKIQVPATPEYAAQFWARVDKMIGEKQEE